MGAQDPRQGRRVNRVTIRRVKGLDRRDVRMDDVARAAGLSRTTVSLVLSGKAGRNIPEVTRQRVRDCGRRAGLRPQRARLGIPPQHLRDSIGLISDMVATTPFAVAMLHGAQEVAWAAGKLLMVVNTEGEAALEARRHHATARAARGRHPLRRRSLPRSSMRTRWPRPGSDRAPGRARPGRIRAVGRARRPGGWSRRDGAPPGRAGHRRIGFISEPGGPAATERLEGYLEVLREHGIAPEPSLIADGSGDTVGGLAAASRLLDAPAPPTAIFCFNDRMAMGAYRAARHRGLSIPADLSIVGYDNHDVIAPWLDPPLTTVQLPHLEMGRWAARQLLGTAGWQRPVGRATGAASDALPHGHARLGGAAPSLTPARSSCRRIAGPPPRSAATALRRRQPPGRTAAERAARHHDRTARRPCMAQRR